MYVDAHTATYITTPSGENITLPIVDKVATPLVQSAVNWGVRKVLYNGSSWAVKSIGAAAGYVGSKALEWSQWGVVEGAKKFWGGTTYYTLEGLRNTQGNATAEGFGNWTRLVENGTAEFYQPYTNASATITNKIGDMLMKVDQIATDRITGDTSVPGFSASELIGPVLVIGGFGFLGANAVYNAFDNASWIFKPNQVVIKEHKEKPRFQGEGNILTPAGTAPVTERDPIENNLSNKISHAFKAGLWSLFAGGCFYVSKQTAVELGNRLAEVDGSVKVVMVMAGTVYGAILAYNLLKPSNPQIKPQKIEERVTVTEIRASSPTTERIT